MMVILPETVRFEIVEVRVATNELLVGVGQCREYPAAAIFLDGVDIHVGARDIDFRKLDLEDVVRSVPAHVRRWGCSGHNRSQRSSQGWKEGTH